MILSELSTLLQFARGLAERKAELDKKYFEQFIQPAWSAFVKVHENYKSSFKKYLEYVNGDEYKVSDLIESIRQDSIDSTDLRSELAAIVHYLPSSTLKVSEEYLINLARAITQYFNVREQIKYVKNKEGVSIVVQDSRPMSNFARYDAIISLSRNGTDNKEEAKRILERVMRELHSGYDKAAHHYYELKKMLLA